MAFDPMRLALFLFFFFFTPTQDPSDPVIDAAHTSRVVFSQIRVAYRPVLRSLMNKPCRRQKGSFKNFLINQADVVQGLIYLQGSYRHFNKIMKHSFKSAPALYSQTISKAIW